MITGWSPLFSILFSSSKEIIIHAKPVISLYFPEVADLARQELYPQKPLC